MRSKYK